MIQTPTSIENLTLSITQEIRVNASLEVTFNALLEQIGPAFVNDVGASLQMKLEPWPGGRWYRDLGNNNGHLWGHVQAIKGPTLLEIYGPLMASYPFVSNVQYRLTEADGATNIAFRHTALGFIQEDHKSGLEKGWATIHEQVRKAAEAR